MLFGADDIKEEKKVKLALISLLKEVYKAYLRNEDYVYWFNPLDALDTTYIIIDGLEVCGFIKCLGEEIFANSQYKAKFKITEKGIAELLSHEL